MVQQSCFAHAAWRNQRHVVAIGEQAAEFLGFSLSIAEVGSRMVSEGEKWVILFCGAKIHRFFKLSMDNLKWIILFEKTSFAHDSSSISSEIHRQKRFPRTFVHLFRNSFLSETAI